MSDEFIKIATKELNEEITEKTPNYTRFALRKVTNFLNCFIVFGLR